MRNVKSIAIAAAAFLGLGLGLHGPAVASAAVGLELITQVESATYLWNAGDDRLFIVERGGRILIYRPGEGLLPTLLDISDRVLVNGERGSGRWRSILTSRATVSSTWPTPEPAAHRSDPRALPGVGWSARRRRPRERGDRLRGAHPSGAHWRSDRRLPHRQTSICRWGTGELERPPCNAEPAAAARKMLRLDISQNLDTPPHHAIRQTILSSVRLTRRRGARRDLVLRSAQFVPLLLRPLDGRPLSRRCRQDGREETDFEPAGAGGANFGWSDGGTLCQNPRGTVLLNAALLRPAYTAPITRCHTRVGPAQHRRFCYRGSAILSCGHVFGDLCSGRIWSVEEVTPGTWGLRRFPQEERFLQSFGRTPMVSSTLTASGNVWWSPRRARSALHRSASRPASMYEPAWADVLTSRGRVDADCVRLAGRGQLQTLGLPPGQQTAEACLGFEPGDRIQRRVGLLATQESTKCRVPGRPELVPSFGYTSTGRVASAAKTMANRFTRSLFGTPVDDAIALASQDAPGARCQAAVVKSAHLLLGALWKVGLEGKKAHLAGKLTSPVLSGVELGDRVLQYVATRTASGRVAAQRGSWRDPRA